MCALSVRMDISSTQQLPALAVVPFQVVSHAPIQQIALSVPVDTTSTEELAAPVLAVAQLVHQHQIAQSVRLQLIYQE